ncbi:hypothetical protein ABEF79_00990 [Acinetobacter sp. ANC 7454]|uniref:hypothetical protein n=1 Tax=Acinetobacter thermotolerans TaxID=3151487 RepID=UPI00325B91EC
MPEQPLNNNTENQIPSVESVLDTLRDYGRLPENGNVQPSSSTPSVEEEMASYGNRTLEEDAAKQDHVRDQKWKNNFSIAFICAFWVLWALFIIMCISLILHWILPTECHWLTVEQLDKIKTIILAALASKAITNKVEKSS